MKKVITLLFISLPFLAEAQGSYVLAEVSYSTFNMSQMKSFQQTYIRQSGLPLKAVISFPSYWGYGASIGLANRENSYFGFSLGYNSTGGRADYEDYSGSVTFDQLLKCFSIGAFVQEKLNASQKWPLFFSCTVSWNRTNLTMTETIDVGSQHQSDELVFHSNNIGLRPAFQLRRKLGNIFVHAGLGYEIQFAGKLHFEDNKKAYLTSGSDDVTAQWAGVRLTLGVGIPLHKSAASNE